MKSEEEIREGMAQAANEANNAKEGSERKCVCIAILTTLEWVLDIDELWKDKKEVN